MNKNEFTEEILRKTITIYPDDTLIELTDSGYIIKKMELVTGGGIYIQAEKVKSVDSPITLK